MSIKIEVSDLENTPPSQLIKLVKYMLECAGYSEPAQDSRPQFSDEKAPAAEHVTLPEREALGAPANPFASVPSLDLTTQAPGIEVDSNGMPWDHRIHSASRNKVGDGSWRMKRGLDEALQAQVEQELRATMGLPAPLASVPALPTTPIEALTQAVVGVPVPPPFVPSAELPAVPVAITPPPPIAPVGAVTTASPSSPKVTFPQLMQAITRAFAAKTLDQNAIMAACNACGIPSLPMLASRPDMVEAVANALGVAL